MRILLFLLSAATFSAAPAAPPREESPPNPQTLREFGQGSSDEEMARAIVAANAYPLGTLQNPIRVGGPDGAFRYIARLRCADGSQPDIGPEVPNGTGAFGTLTTIIPLACRSQAPARLVFDYYQQEYSESRPAPGFQITP